MNGQEVVVYTTTRGRKKGRRCTACGRRVRRAEDVADLLEDFHLYFQEIVRKEANEIALATQRGEYTFDEHLGLIQSLRMMVQTNPRGNEVGWKQYMDLKAGIQARQARERQSREAPKC